MLASFLSVSASQPTQWIKGVESPNPENARTIVDIDHVIAHLMTEVGTDSAFGDTYALEDWPALVAAAHRCPRRGLLACGVAPEVAQTSVRFTFGRAVLPDDAPQKLAALIAAAVAAV